jgi:hypothetical protein
LKLYDPRVKDHVETNNPAIIIAQILIDTGMFSPTEDFWKKIADLANYSDEYIVVE